MCTASASELLAKGSALSSLQIEQPVIEEFASDMHAYHLTQGQPITRQFAVKAAQPQHLQQLAFEGRGGLSNVRHGHVPARSLRQPGQVNCSAKQD
jgi:hypothetical protein